MLKAIKIRIYPTDNQEVIYKLTFFNNKNLVDIG